MLYAISHQTEAVYSEEDHYQFPINQRAFTTRHAMSKWIHGKVRCHNELFGWFFDLENHLTEIIESRKEPVAYEAVMKGVSLLTEFQDPYAAEHQKKTSELAVGIAREMGLPADMTEGIRVAGFVYDMGKMSVSAEIVAKPSNPMPLEFSIMKGWMDRALHKSSRKMRFG